MSFLSSSAFEPKVTNNRFDDTCNIAGRYQVSSVDTDCSAGLLCTRTELMADSAFSGITNLNTWIMGSASAATLVNEPIYACNTHDSQMLNGFHVGNKTLGLGAPAGEVVTFTKIDFTGDKIYRFGVGNFTGAISTNKFATIVDGQLSAAASAPSDAGTPYFKILATGTFREGSSDAFGFVDVQPAHA